MTSTSRFSVLRSFFPSPAQLGLLLLCIGLCGAFFPVSAQTVNANRVIPSRVILPVDNAKLVTLKGSTPASARAEFDRGAVPYGTPAEHIHLLLKRSEAQEAALKQLIAAQHDPSSPQYHHWLTGAEFGAAFGPSQQDLDQVRTWLQSQGFTINKTSVGNVAIDVTGTAGMVRSAFHTELHTYQHNGVVYHSNNSDPAIPAALAPVVAGVVSLNDIKPTPNLTVKGTAAYNPRNHTAQPNWNYGEFCYSPPDFLPVPCTLYVPGPADLAVQYSLTGIQAAGTTGAGETVGVIGDANIDLGVVQNYRALFGFKNLNNLPRVIVDGNDPGQNDDSTESFLDVEAVSAMAPDATVNLYVSDGSIASSGLINAIVRAVDDNTADVLTASYGVCEQQFGSAGNAFAAEMWQQAAAQGQTVLVSAGDGGSDACDNFNYTAQATSGLGVNGLASTPFDTAVGGTDFYYSNYAQGKNSPAVLQQLEAAWGGGQSNLTPTASLIAPLQEQPWNDGFGLNISGNPNQGYDIVGGGGGASSCVTGTNADPTTGVFGTCTAGYPKPSWQAGQGVPPDGVRDLPDVSLFAAAGENRSFWPVCTSVTDCLASTTPVGESIYVSAVGGTSAASPAMAGVVALLDQTQKGRQGNINYKLYALATQYPNSFNDVTVGSNNVVCVQGSPNCSLDTNGDGLYSLQHYSAGPGYDQASGLGTINAANLFANWNKVTVSSGTTQTALSLAQTSFVHGTAVTATATVTGTGGTPTGAVVLQTDIPGQVGQGTENEVAGQIVSGTINLTGGKGTGSLASLPGGSYNVTGIYSGDGAFAKSTSSPVAVTVTPEASTTSLSGAYLDPKTAPGTLKNGGTYNYGDTYYMDALLAGKSGFGTPTGAVTFMDGSTSLGTANFDQGSIAEFVTGRLTPGSHSVTAVYAGDPSFAASTSTPLTLTVVKGTPHVSYDGYRGGSFLPVSTGQPLEVSAVVSSGYNAAVPTGTVTFTFGSLPPQTATLVPSYPGVSAATAHVFITPPVAGTFNLTADYGGDSNYNPSSLDSPVGIRVTTPTGAPTTVKLVTSTSTVGPDDIVSMTAQVTGSIPNVIPTGNVAFSLDGIPLAYIVSVDATGSATFEQNGGSITNGPHILNVTYLGDATNAPSISNTVPINSNQGDFSITATAQNLTIAAGSSATTTLSLASTLFSVQQAAGFAGPASLTCTVSSPSVLCSLSASTVTLTEDGKQQNVTATINTRILTSKNEAPVGGFRRPLTGGGTVLAMLFIVLPWRRKRFGRVLFTMLAGFVLLGMTTIGCGNSTSTSSQPPPSPTPPAGTNASPGTYNVLVSANASGIQHTLLLHVKVQ